MLIKPITMETQERTKEARRRKPASFVAGSAAEHDAEIMKSRAINNVLEPREAYNSFHENITLASTSLRLSPLRLFSSSFFSASNFSSSPFSSSSSSSLVSFSSLSPLPRTVGFSSCHKSERYHPRL